MSWGPSARQGYRYRKMAGRAAARAYRKTHSGSSSPRQSIGLHTAPESPRRPARPPAEQYGLLALLDEVARDQQYFNGVRMLFFLTLAPALFVLLFIPTTFFLSVLCYVLGSLLVSEGIVLFVYWGQLRQSQARLIETKIQQVEPVAQELTETQWQEFLLRQKRQSQDEIWLDYELSWRRDMKHGNSTDEARQRKQQQLQAESVKQQQIALDEERCRQHEAIAVEHSILDPDCKERQIQELEQMVRRGLVR